MNKRKIMVMAMALCMVAILAVGGSLAYFADVENETNVFTVGRVDVELIESTVHRAGATGYEDVEGYPETPAGEDGNHSDEQILAGSGENNETYQEYLKNAPELLPGTQINKMIYAKNNGNTDIWVRFRVKIPTALDTLCMASNFCTTAVKGEGAEFTMLPMIEQSGNGTTEGDWNVYTFVRNEPLPAGEMTYWNIWNTIAIASDINNEDLALAVDELDEDWRFSVLVELDAIQADNLNTPDEAWAAFEAETGNKDYETTVGAALND